MFTEKSETLPGPRKSCLDECIWKYEKGTIQYLPNIGFI